MSITRSFINKACVFIFCFVSTLTISAQDQKVADSLRIIYNADTATGVTKLRLLRDISFNEVRDFTFSLGCAEELISLSAEQKNDKFLFHGYYQKGNKERILGDYPEALKAFSASFEAAKRIDSVSYEANAYGAIADIYSLSGNFSVAHDYYRKAISTLRRTDDTIALASFVLNAGEDFRKHKQYDSALAYFKESEDIFKTSHHTSGKAYSKGNIGMVYVSTGKREPGEKNINEAIDTLTSLGDFSPVCDYLIFLSDLYLNDNDVLKALSFAEKSIQLARQSNFKEQINNADLKLSEIYEKAGKWQESLKYYKDYIVYRDSLSTGISEIKTEYLISLNKAELMGLEIQKKQQARLLIIALIVLIIIVVLLINAFRNNRLKNKAYLLLNKAKVVAEEQRDQTNQALEKLKRTQAHLIQSAKMASLGELTAGIAHEIQNPLNFVNNFSELNSELITELQEENKKGNIDTVQSISEEIYRNAEKISHHGKRADAIVKGMLQHSRASASEKKLTNINSLVEQYFRLAYHGFKAKDKSFNVAIHDNLDPGAGEINIVPQEVARVILNLVNNAFEAVLAKKEEAGKAFYPEVTVSTKRTNDRLIISVKDNGVGIPKEVKEKIFQPFFTTKGPGGSTGLGLSLSYDTVKAHSGEIKVETEEGVGSEFIIILPLDLDEG